jgi:hypothetical protein
MKYVKTFEQHSNVEMTNEEILGFGKKTYKLAEFKADEGTESFFNKRKDLVKKYKEGFTRVGVPAELVDAAVKSLIAFTGGGKSIPLMDKYDYTFDKDKKELIINPNGKGLFNGHPIMG